jgi:hypothetical protein
MDDMDDFGNVYLDDFALTPELVQYLALEWQGREFAVLDLCTLEELQAAFERDPHQGMRELIIGRMDARMQSDGQV